MRGQTPLRVRKLEGSGAKRSRDQVRPALRSGPCSWGIQGTSGGRVAPKAPDYSAATLCREWAPFTLRAEKGHTTSSGAHAPDVSALLNTGVVL